MYEKARVPPEQYGGTRYSSIYDTVCFSPGSVFVCLLFLSRYLCLIYLKRKVIIIMLNKTPNAFATIIIISSICMP